MVEQIHLLIVCPVVVKLGVVVGGHEPAAAELVHHAGHAADGHGEIVRPGLHRADDSHSLGVEVRHLVGQSADALLQKALQLIHAAHLMLFAVGVGGQLQIDVGDHPARPVRPDPEDLIVGAGGPVVAAVDHAPFLGGEGAEHQRLFGLVARQLQSPGHAQHQGNGGVVVLEALKIGIVVSAHQNHLVGVLAGQGAHDVVALGFGHHGGQCVQCHLGAAAEAKVSRFGQRGRVLSGDGEGRRLPRAADVLGVQRLLVHLAVAARLHRQNGRRAPQMGLVGRVVDPPVVALVDVHQHQLAPHVQPVQLGGGAGARVDEGVVLRALGVKVGLVAAQLGGAGAALFVFISKAGVVEVPPVQRKAVLFHRKADGAHLGGQQLAGLELGPAAGGAVAQHRVGAGLLHPLCQHVGIRDIQIPPDAVPLLQLLFDHFHTRFPLQTASRFGSTAQINPF